MGVQQDRKLVPSGVVCRTIHPPYLRGFTYPRRDSRRTLEYRQSGSQLRPLGYRLDAGEANEGDGAAEQVAGCLSDGAVCQIMDIGEEVICLPRPHFPPCTFVSAIH